MNMAYATQMFAVFQKSLRNIDKQIIKSDIE